MPSNAPTIVFIRHGITDWNAEGRLQGQRDVPLNEQGRAQARRNGKVIAEAIPNVRTFDFVASPFSRARETMELARGEMGLDPHAYRIEELLREVTFGDWESYTLDDIRAREPQGLKAREADKWRFRPPGGESYEQLAERMKPWLDTLDRPTVIAAHGGTARVLSVRLSRMDPATAAIIQIPHDKVFLWRDGVASLI